MSLIRTIVSLAGHARRAAGSWQETQKRAGRCGEALHRIQDSIVQRDYDLAVAGNAQAQYEMGERFYQGLGVEKDYAPAASWFTLAAQQGHAVAQRLLAMMYFLGRGVPADSAEAYKWIQLAVARGDADARDIEKKMLAKLSPEAVAEGRKRAAPLMPPADATT